MDCACRRTRIDGDYWAGVRWKSSGAVLSHRWVFAKHCPDHCVSSVVANLGVVSAARSTVPFELLDVWIDMISK